MGMQQAPRPQRSSWMRYAPYIAVVVIIAIVVVVLVVINSDDKKNNKVSVGNGGSTANTVVTKSGTNGVPLFYNDAKAAGDAGKHTWQDPCDTSTGSVEIPTLNPPPC